MTTDLNQFPELDKTKFEQRGIQLEIGVPVTCAVSIGNNIAAGFGDGTVRIFSSGEKHKTLKAHKGVILCMAKDGDNILTCLLYTSPSPRDGLLSRMPSSA